MPAVGERIDPIRAYKYRIELDNVTEAVAGFSEASGFSTLEVEPTEYREGTDPMYVRKLSGLRKFSNISLKRGYSDNSELYDWYASSLNGSVERRNGSITLQDEDGVDRIRWNFSEGWICKYEGPMLNATGSDVAIETIEICVELIEIEFLQS